MFRFDKTGLLAFLMIPLALTACKPTRGTASPEDYFPLIQVALGGAETAAMIGRNEALRAKDFPGCVASEALISGFGAANEALTGRLMAKIVIPAVDLDLSECLTLREDKGSALKVSGTKVAGYIVETEAGEPSPSEVVPEAAPVEQEALPVEETISFKGNEDAAVLVESIAGITLAAVTHYAVRLQTVNCKKGTAALGVVAYIQGMIGPISNEIAEPDGKLSLPSVAIDLSKCLEG